MAQRLKTDWILFTTVLVMTFFGLIVVYSASSVMAELRYGSSWHFLVRQSIWLVFGIIAMMVLKRTNYRGLRDSKLAFPLIGFALILLIIVYFWDSAHHRWIRMGVLSFQPSEFAKPALVLFLAYFVTQRARAINASSTLLPAALSVGLVIFMVIIADLGTAVVLGATAGVVFFVAGLELRYVAIAAVLAGVGLVGFVVSKPYRVARIVGHVDPEFRLIDRVDPQGHIKEYLKRSLVSRDTSYQADQSKIAVGAGGPAGLGLMLGKQKLLYLPEAHTDFIYAVLSEELGLIGSAGVLAGFILIFWRGLRAAVLIGDDFGRYVALGVTTMIIFQAFLNMSVVLGMMPTKGIPLPMISSGGSSLLSTLALSGMLMNVSEHAG